MRCIENFRLAAVCKSAFERLLHECDDGHGADATGDGGDVGGALCCGFEIDIAVDDAIGCFGESAVDDDGSGFNPIAFDELGGSSGDDEEIGASDVLGQIACARMAHGDGCIVALEHEANRLADDVAATDDDGIETFEGDVVGLQESNDAAGRAWLERIRFA